MAELGAAIEVEELELTRARIPLHRQRQVLLVDPRADLMVETPERREVGHKRDVDHLVPPQLYLRSADYIMRCRPIDIVPADYVSKAIVKIHQKNSPLYPRYHLSSGTGSQTYRELTDALAQGSGGSRPTYLPSLGRTFSGAVNWLSHKKNNLGRGASLLKVFWPYLVWNTVFDNSRVVEELGGETPAKFSLYAQPLLKFSREHKFRYPAKPWPLQNASVNTSTSGKSVSGTNVGGTKAGGRGV